MEEKKQLDALLDVYKQYLEDEIEAIKKEKEERSIEQLAEEIRIYAKDRLGAVHRGRETPHLAALLLHNYGVGVIVAVRTIYKSRHAAEFLYRVLDEETTNIDPDW